MPSPNQAEWCPVSHRVCAKLTELGIDYAVVNVSASAKKRDELEEVAGTRAIAVLIDRCCSTRVAGVPDAVVYAVLIAVEEALTLLPGRLSHGPPKLHALFYSAHVPLKANSPARS